MEVRTSAEWLAAGMSRRKLGSLVDTGLLVRIRYGVYATKALMKQAEHDPRFRHAVQAAAARAATGRDSAASHESAALMHGVALLHSPPADQVTLTRPPGGWRGRTGPTGTIFHAAGLPKEHVTSYRGVPVTTAARTVADLARTSTFMAGVVSADSALHRHKTTSEAVKKIVAAEPNWPGAARARNVIEFADDRSESPLESCARVVFANHKLPPPQLQVNLGGARYAGRVDFYWPEYTTVAEADGDLKYSDQADALKQLERDQLLRAGGFRVVHFTWYQLFREQDVVIGRILSAFRGEIS